jgi:hypothetical protein
LPVAVCGVVAAVSFLTGGRLAQALTSYTLDGASWGVPAASAQGPLTLAVRLTTSASGQVSTIRFYKDSSFIGAHTAFVWDATGNVLGQQAFTNETTSGWQQVTLTTPVPINAGDTFSVGYTLENGFSYIGSGFAATTFGPLTIVGGYYVYQASSFPSNAYSSNYMVDLTFDAGAAPATTTTVPATSSTAATTTSSTTTALATTAPTTTAPAATTTAATTPLLPPAATTTSTSSVPSSDAATTTTATTTTAATTPAATTPATTTPAASDVVAATLAGPVSPEVAAQLATDPAVLATVTPDQAATVFKALDVGSLTPDAKAALAAAVSAAPEAVKAAFERTIDVYGAGLDHYVPNGSKVNVATRRSIVAATAAVASAAAATTRGSSSPDNSNDDGRRSTGVDPADDELARINRSVARRRARNLGGRTRRFTSNDSEETMADSSRTGRFIRRLAREVSAMSFTLAGSVIVLATLSGRTRTIALVATVVALVLHFGVALTRDED